MSRVSHFQRFSQPENHATNNTLLVLRHLYQASPYKIQRLLTSLVETDLSVGLAFDQQIKGKKSVPDAAITQAALRIFIETKRGGDIDKDQIRRHFESITPESGTAGSGDFLIALTKEPLADAERKALTVEGGARQISFTAVTFSQIVEALRAQCAEFETDLLSIVEDYDSYLADEGLIESRNQWLVVFPCGTSIAENAKFGIYYEPSSRPCKRNYRFIGIYKQKTVAYVGVVEAIAVVTYADGAYVFVPEAGKLTAAHERRIKDTIEATPYYDLKDNDTRFYLVDQFVPTDARKTSSGGIMGLRYLDLAALIPAYEPRKDYTSAELAAIPFI